MLKGGILIWLLAGVLSNPPKRVERAFAPPPAPAERFRVTTRNVPAARIAGVVMPARQQAKGTIFICHGWGARKELMYGWEWVRGQLGWNVVVFDFREHGQSSHSPRLCTLGFHEIWDVKAVVDYAEERGLAKPYVICGYSLGASVGLRWAAHDARVSGVLAVSPYRNGMLGSRQFVRSWLGIDPHGTGWTNGYVRMLRAVDLPTDVTRRNDLRLWIVAAEHDVFPVADQRAILDASPSPAALKRFFVIPGANHGTTWRWQGDARVPSHDRIIRDFLSESERGRK
jgi:pimeloyl-ACP methyl ester carboxylesterase